MRWSVRQISANTQLICIHSAPAFTKMVGKEKVASLKNASIATVASVHVVGPTSDGGLGNHFYLYSATYL